MAQLLRAPAALPEHPGLIPSTLISVPGESDALCWPLWALHAGKCIQDVSASKTLIYIK